MVDHSDAHAAAHVEDRDRNLDDGMVVHGETNAADCLGAVEARYMALHLEFLVRKKTHLEVG